MKAAKMVDLARRSRLIAELHGLKSRLMSVMWAHHEPRQRNPSQMLAE